MRCGRATKNRAGAKSACRIRPRFANVAFRSTKGCPFADRKASIDRCTISHGHIASGPQPGVGSWYDGSMTSQILQSVGSAERQARLAEYRRVGLERQAPAHVVYQDEHLECPWADCTCRLAGVNFRLDLQGDADAVRNWLAAWWSGPGLVGRCPGCDHYVLFSLDGKRAVSDPSQWGAALLPDDWHKRAHVVARPA